MPSSDEQVGGSSHPKARPLSKTGLIGIVSGLRNLIAKLEWKPAGTEWADLLPGDQLSDDAFVAKPKAHFEAFLGRDFDRHPVWDFEPTPDTSVDWASNQGHSDALPSILIGRGENSITVRHAKAPSQKYPDVGDGSDQSVSAIGWNSSERDSLVERGPVDCAMPLALIHHLGDSPTTFHWTQDRRFPLPVSVAT